MVRHAWLIDVLCFLSDQEKAREAMAAAAVAAAVVLAALSDRGGRLTGSAPTPTATIRTLAGAPTAIGVRYISSSTAATDS